MPIIHTSVMYMATVILRLTKHELTNMFSTGDPGDRTAVANVGLYRPAGATTVGVLHA